VSDVYVPRIFMGHIHPLVGCTCTGLQLGQLHVYSHVVVRDVHMHWPTVRSVVYVRACSCVRCTYALARSWVSFMRTGMELWKMYMYWPVVGWFACVLAYTCVKSTCTGPQLGQCKKKKKRVSYMCTFCFSICVLARCCVKYLYVLARSCVRRMCTGTQCCVNIGICFV
jgi:hypothetical protein